MTDSAVHRAKLDLIAAAGTGDGDIAGAALACSGLARPKLDLDPYHAHLGEISAGAVRALSQGSAATVDPRHVGFALSATLRAGFGYEGDRTTYDDLKNADLAHVIDRRRGLPVALGILYIHAARALGATAHGINFPGHFVVGIATGTGSILIDPFNGGQAVDAEDLEAMLPMGTRLQQDHVTALSDRGTLIRLQNNILTRSREGGDWPRAALTLEILSRIAPENAQFRYELGDAYTRIERPNAARKTLQDAIALAPDAPWSAEARRLLAATKRSLN